MYDAVADRMEQYNLSNNSDFDEEFEESIWMDRKFDGSTIAAYMPTPNIIVLSGVYIVFTTLGLLGNGIVITMIIRILWSRRMIINVYFYVLCLSAVDFIFLATGPLTIAFMINGNWTYGPALCKIAFFCEGLNKTVSIYLLVILSADRYLAVCKPATSARYRSIKASLVALAILFICVLITNIPIYKYATVTYRATENDTGIAYCAMLFPKLNESGSDIDPWNHFGSYYTLTLILCYYVAPAALICVFYVKLLSRLKERYKTLRKRCTNKRKKVTTSILAVIAFYFICWSPYWLLQMVIQFFPRITVESEEAQVVFLYLATSVYTLPYVNSSIDPVLYAFLNKRLRKAYADTSRRLRKADRSDFEASADDVQRAARSYSMHGLMHAHRGNISARSATNQCSDQQSPDTSNTLFLTPLAYNRRTSAC